MSLDKAIRYNKEYRKRYYGSKAVDSSCRNHGTCAWCRSNRTHNNDKRQLSAEEKEAEYEGYE